MRKRVWTMEMVSVNFGDVQVNMFHEPVMDNDPRKIDWAHSSGIQSRYIYDSNEGIVFFGGIEHGALMALALHYHFKRFVFSDIDKLVEYARTYLKSQQVQQNNLYCLKRYIDDLASIETQHDFECRYSIVRSDYLQRCVDRHYVAVHKF